MKARNLDSVVVIAFVSVFCGAGEGVVRSCPLLRDDIVAPGHLLEVRLQ